MFNIVQRRYWYFGLSLLVIIPGLIALAVWGLPLSIDFTSGSLLEVQFPQHTVALDIAQVRQIYSDHGYPDTTVQTSGADTIVVRSKSLSVDDQRAILAALVGRLRAIQDHLGRHGQPNGRRRSGAARGVGGGHRRRRHPGLYHLRVS